MAASPQRIIVRGVNWLGDAVMTSPALQRLREAHPKAHITLLTPEKLAGLWLHHPSIDEVFSVPKSTGLASLALQLRKRRFDTALILPNSPRSALEMCLAGIPRRIGVQGRWRSLFLTDIVAAQPGITAMRKRSVEEVRQRQADPTAQRETYPTSSHHLFHYMHLASALGAKTEPLAPHLEIKASERGDFFLKFTKSPEDDGKWLGLNAGAEYGPAKRWPAERFTEAARVISKATGRRWLIFGGPADQALADSIAHTLGPAHALPVAGRTSLRQLCVGLSACRVVLTNDTGPMHVAAAVGAKLVIPFGSTSPELTGPGLPGSGREGWVLGEAGCAPCFLRQCPVDFRCMKSISIETVVRKVLEQLG